MHFKIKFQLISFSLLCEGAKVKEAIQMSYSIIGSAELKSVSVLERCGIDYPAWRFQLLFENKKK